MFLRRSASTVRSAPTYRPALESLEERQVLTVTPVFSGGVLTLTGSGGGDGIRVVDSGRTTAGDTVSVFSGLNPFAVFTTPVGATVNQIVIRTLGGGDAVVYSVTGSAAGEHRTVTVDLGAGNDAFTLLMGNGLTQGANWQVDVFGKAGNDALAATLAGRLAGLTGGQPPAFLGVNFTGGAGRDSLTTNYSGDLDGTFNLSCVGGGDRDAISANLALLAGSTGSVIAREYGGAANDALTLNITKTVANDPVTVDGLIDGGGGTDTCSSTANVTKVNCP